MRGGGEKGLKGGFIGGGGGRAWLQLITILCFIAGS